MGHGTTAAAGDHSRAMPAIAALPIDLIAEAQHLMSGYAEAAGGASWSDQLVGMRRLIDQFEAMWLGQAALFEEGGCAADEGASTLGAWLRHKCQLAPAEATSRARVAQSMTAGDLPAVANAMAAGEVSWRHADVIGQAVRQVPAEHRETAEQLLVEPAKSLDPLLLKRLGQEVLHRLDVDSAERAALRRLERRGLDIAETFDGMVALHGLLDPVSGATLLTAIDALVSPTRGDLAEIRSWSQRRADALTEICGHWLDHGDTPQVGGQRPHVSVLIDVRALSKEQSGGGELEWVGPITAEQARKIACDAGLSGILTDGPREVLDVGRSTRTIPPGIRRAVVARDRQCVADGCYRAQQHCEVHHIKFWRDGGTTSLDNLVLLCRRHHGFVHDLGWTVQRDAAGAMRLCHPTAHAPP